jgi:CheY-like chemotaxis protein
MGFQILTVDDSKTIRTIIKQILSEFDCQVIEASNGKEGLEAILKERPDLVILDIDMPGMNGLDMLMKVRNNDDIMNTPVIMLTSKAKPHNIRIAKELDIVAFLAKPFNRQLLIDRISKVVELSPCA